MILGFDNDDETCFDAQREFLRAARITHAMIGMLTAIPKTPLHARLAAEGRLDLEDVSEFGTNVIPLRMSRESLRNGYVEVLKDLYEPEAFFDRVDDLYLAQRAPFFAAMQSYFRDHRWRHGCETAKNLGQALGLFFRLMRRVPEAALRRAYRRRLGGLLQRRPEPRLIFLYCVKCAMHFHHCTMARQMAVGRATLVNSF